MTDGRRWTVDGGRWPVNDEQINESTNHLFIEENHLGHEYGSLLIEKAKKEAREARFKYIYLCTKHVGYYEKYNFRYVGQGYHPWGEESRIYELEL